MSLTPDAASPSNIQQSAPKKIRLIVGQYSWRMVLIRVLVNALALILISIILPDLYFVDRRLLNVLFLAVMLGLLNAYIKPLIQFLTLPFIFVTYGLVVVGINALMLLLLARFFPARFAVDSLFWALIGGALFGLFASVLESLLGLNLPIIDSSDRSDSIIERTTPPAHPTNTILLSELSKTEDSSSHVDVQAGAVSGEQAIPEDSASEEAESVNPRLTEDAPRTTDSASGSYTTTYTRDE